MQHSTKDNMKNILFCVQYVVLQCYLNCIKAIHSSHQLFICHDIRHRVLLCLSNNGWWKSTPWPTKRLYISPNHDIPFDMLTEMYATLGPFQKAICELVSNYLVTNVTIVLWTLDDLQGSLSFRTVINPILSE